MNNKNSIYINEIFNKSKQQILHSFSYLNLQMRNDRFDIKEVVNHIITHSNESGVKVYFTGILEIMKEGFGFIRNESENYYNSKVDCYIAAISIKKNFLKNGDVVTVQLERSKKAANVYATEVILLNDKKFVAEERATDFDHLIAEYPQTQLIPTTNNIAAKITSVISPMGLGQRCLIIAPPKSGKTSLLIDITQGIVNNKKVNRSIFLLCGERPEEVTAIKHKFKDNNLIEIRSSTFDTSPLQQIQIAELALARAKRCVENGENVCLFIDSLTRIARAYNEISPSSGKIMSGGAEQQAIYKAKRFFGAARNTSSAGTLTIIATILKDTGSKMDNITFEEFKGTSNMDIVLSKALADRYIFPAISVNQTGTRHPELIIGVENNEKLSNLKRALSNLTDREALELLRNKVAKFDNCISFLENIS